MTFPCIALHRDNGAGLSEQLVVGLEAAIERGELEAGARLPSERDLARRLGVSRTTVVNAYHELVARGLLRGHVGRGTFVCASPERSGAPFAWRGKVALGAQRAVDPELSEYLRAGADPQLISFAAGVPAMECFPLREFRVLTDQVLVEQPVAALGLSPTEGRPELRDALARRFRVRPSQVLVLAGAQQGLDLVARCLLDPGDTVLMDRPGYLGAIQTFRAAGANLIGWDIAQADLDELEDLLLRYRPKLIYTCPTFSNPTGATLSTEDRRGLLRLARQYRVPVVEDDPHAELAFDAPPPPPLFQLDDDDLVIYLSTLSKILAPGLRLGWLVATEAIVHQLAMLKQHSDLHCPGLSQLVAAEMIARGLFARHVRCLRAEHRARRDAMLAAMAQYLPPGLLSCERPRGGIYLWCRLRRGLQARQLLPLAMSVGVSFAVGDRFFVDEAGADRLRLCFSSLPPARIEDGIRRLGRVLTSERLAHLERRAPLMPLV